MELVLSRPFAAAIIESGLLNSGDRQAESRIRDVMAAAGNPATVDWRALAGDAAVLASALEAMAFETSDAGEAARRLDVATMVRVAAGDQARGGPRLAWRRTGPVSFLAHGTTGVRWDLEACGRRNSVARYAGAMPQNQPPSIEMAH
jgi:hypothetical protein